MNQQRKRFEVGTRWPLRMLHYSRRLTPAFGHLSPAKATGEGTSQHSLSLQAPLHLLLVERGGRRPG
jgi:hypothetical protein